MKKIVIVLLMFVLWQSCCLAQSVYDPLLDGNFVPVKIIFGDGVIQEMQMMYRQPEFFKNPLHKHRLAKSDGTDAYDHQGGIEAFMINGNIWLQRTVNGQNQFVVLRKQGAMEVIEYIINGKVGSDVTTGAYMIVGNRSKTIIRNTLKNETLEPSALTEAKVREWIADSPTALDDLQKAIDAAAEAQKNTNNPAPTATPKKGLIGALEKAAAKETEMKNKAATNIDFIRILNNYNVWYASNSGNASKFYFEYSPMREELPTRVKTLEEVKAENKVKQEKLFSGRSSTVAPEFASAKDNTPVKKETFASKLDRIKTDGNKVGVILYLEPVRVNPPDASGNIMGANLTDYTKVDGEYMDESLRATANDFVLELNQALNTSMIELIDINTVPYRQTKFGRLDDWWASKYKVVFAYTLDPRIRSSNEEIGGKIKFTASLNMITSLIVREYIGEPTATKQDIITQVLNMGSFVTSTFAQEEQMTDVKAIYDKTLEKLAVPLLSKIKEERADAIKKLVEKKLN